MTKRARRKIAIELMAATIAETIEGVHDLSVAALPPDLRSYRASVRRLAEAGRDVTALASAMEVLIRRA
jgi:hypothetical protein